MTEEKARGDGVICDRAGLHLAVNQNMRYDQSVRALKDLLTRGWLGVQIQEVTPAIAASLGLHHERGALVAVVTPDGPAAKAGLKQGDVILAFNGTRVSELHDLGMKATERVPAGAGVRTRAPRGRQGAAAHP